MSGRIRVWFALFLLAAAAAPVYSQATGADSRIAIDKVDPPNWWADLPKPMLLIKGHRLEGAHFTLSDRTLSIVRVRTSSNGDWAELWLNSSPKVPETIRISASAGSQHTSTPFSFSQRRAASDGFAGFSSRDVMYLIMTDRFADGDPSNDDPASERTKPRGWHGGDLRGIIDHLDYLQHLGITTLWITPVYQNAGPESYHGYGATDMYAVDPHFGSLDDLKALASSLHQRHMKLVLDMVPNHVGPTHPWVDDEPEPDWFHGTKAHHTTAVGEFAPLTDPHAPWRDQRDIIQGWFAGVLPDLNQENPSVSQYLIQNAVWWTEATGADGLRLDTFPYVGRPFWHAFHAELHTLFPRLTTVGEIFNPDPVLVSAFASGAARSGVEDTDTGLDTPFDYPMHFALVDVFAKNQPMTRIAATLRDDSLYPHPERLVTFLDNHDVVRFMSEPGATTQRLILALTALTTMRGMPQLYSGDEIAMQGGDDPDNRRNFPGGFPGSTADAFTAAGRTPEQQQVFASLRKLLALRAATPALQSGREQLLHTDDDVLVYVRTLISGNHPQHVVIAINKGHAAQTVEIETTNTAIAGLQQTMPLLDKAQQCKVVPGHITLQLDPESATIFSMQ